MRKAVLIIDAQRDFVNPNGALPVAGAVEDMQRLGAFITKHQTSIDFIGMTLNKTLLLNKQ